MEPETTKKLVGGIAAAGVAVLAYKKLFSSGTDDKLALQGNPNGPLDQPGGGNSRPKSVPRADSLRRFTPKRQYHRYWTEAPKPHHLETEPFKNLSFTRIFSW